MHGCAERSYIRTRLPRFFPKKASAAVRKYVPGAVCHLWAEEAQVQVNKLLIVLHVCPPTGGEFGNWREMNGTLK